MNGGSLWQWGVSPRFVVAEVGHVARRTDWWVLTHHDGRPLRTTALAVPPPWAPPPVPVHVRAAPHLEPLPARRPQALPPGAPEPPTYQECKAWRERLGYSQRDVAALTGFSPGMVAHMEADDRPGPLLRQKIGELMARMAGGQP